MRGKIGSVEVVGVQDSPLHFPLKMMISEAEVGGVPYENLLPADYYDPATGLTNMPINVWFLRSEGKIILVDSGCGDLPRAGMPELFPEWPHSKSPLLERLAAEGVEPDDVDIVLCTHLHLDHVGGHTCRVDGEWVPMFPNATYVMCRAEYEHTESAAAEQPEFLKRIFLDSVQPLMDAGVALLVDGEYRVDANITMRPSAGHSAGHMHVEVKSGDDLAIIAGDLIHFPFEITQPEIESSASDHDVDAAVRVRKDLLEDSAERNAVVLTTHLHDPGAGRIRRGGDSYRYQPGWD